MTNQGEDRRGTFWDWPTGWILAGVLLVLVSGANAAGGGMLIGFVIAGIGAFAFLSRRGSLTPRERP